MNDPTRRGHEPNEPSTFDVRVHDDDVVSLRVHAKVAGAVIAGIARAVRSIGAVLRRVHLNRGDHLVAAELRFVADDDRSLSVGQRAALMTLVLGAIDRVTTLAAPAPPAPPALEASPASSP